MFRHVTRSPPSASAPAGGCRMRGGVRLGGGLPWGSQGGCWDVQEGAADEVTAPELTKCISRFPF